MARVLHLWIDLHPGGAATVGVSGPEGERMRAHSDLDAAIMDARAELRHIHNLILELRSEARAREESQTSSGSIELASG